MPSERIEPLNDRGDLHEQWVAAIAHALGWPSESVQWLLDQYDPPEDANDE